MMVIHLRSLDETTLARGVYEEQKEKDWPGLAKETKNICLNLNIEDCNNTQIGKTKYRGYVTQACHIVNEIDETRKLFKACFCQTYFAGKGMDI